MNQVASVVTPFTPVPITHHMGAMELSRDVRRIACRQNEALMFEMTKPIIREAPWEVLVVSKVSVNYRLLRLKSELLNMVALLPLGKMRWPAGEKLLLDAEAALISVGSTVSTTYGSGVVKSIRDDGMLIIEPARWVLANGKVPVFYMMRSPPPHTPLVVASNAKNSQSNEISSPSKEQYSIRKREVAMKVASDAFVVKVQMCSTNQGLLDLIIELEGALPEAATVQFDSSGLPSG
jgi:hypothetical protein